MEKIVSRVELSEDPALPGEILNKAESLFVAFQTGDFPYVLPFNHVWLDGRIYIHCALEGRKIEPKEILVVGGPAPYMAKRIGEMMDCPVKVPNDSDVINASGAATARTTVELNIVADTEAQVLSIAEEGIQQEIPKRFTLEDVIELGTEKLVRKAKEAGARDEDIVVEVADSQVFNVVRGYSTIGKNMRVRLQVKPGLIKEESN